MLGVLVNTLAVIAGSTCGLLFKKAIPQKLSSGVMTALALCTLYIGVDGMLNGANVLLIIIAMVLGAVVGYLLNIDGGISRLGQWVENRFARASSGTVAQGFVTASLLFCVGAMTVTGAMEAAMLHQHTTYYAKAMIDMVSAVIFAFSLGYGVLFSAVSVFLIQGTYTLIALLAAGAIPALVTGEMMAVGSLLVVAIGTNLMKVTDIKVMNYLPAMFFPIALVPLMQLFA